MGYSIFLHNNSLELQDGGTQRDMLEYVVPSTAADHVEKEMIKHNITSELLRTLNTEDVEETKQSAFLELFSHPEMDSLTIMISALGAAGIKGYDNPAALNLYTIMFNFAKLRKAFESGQTGPVDQEKVTAAKQTQAERRGKRATCSRPDFVWFGGDIIYSCSRCPENDCIGMCGQGCNCWDWVCGDCCYHQGCYEHDICCLVNGYLHYTCSLAFSLTCNSYGYSC